MSNVNVSRSFAAFKESKQIPVFITDTSAVITKMTGNAWFAALAATVAAAAQHVTDLQKAEEQVRTGLKGAAQDRNVKLGIVRSDVRVLKAGVQSVADANAASAKAIIESAGMTVSKKPTRTKPLFAVKYGAVPGRVRLEAKSSGSGTTYYWCMSTDQKVWTSLPETRVCKTLVDGLTAGTTYYFRFRTLTKDGLSDWSFAVNIIAH